MAAHATELQGQPEHDLIRIITTVIRPFITAFSRRSET